MNLEGVPGELLRNVQQKVDEGIPQLLCAGDRREYARILACESSAEVAMDFFGPRHIPGRQEATEMKWTKEMLAPRPRKRKKQKQVAKARGRSQWPRSLMTER